MIIIEKEKQIKLNFSPDPNLIAKSAFYIALDVGRRLPEVENTSQLHQGILTFTP